MAPCMTFTMYPKPAILPARYSMVSRDSVKTSTFSSGSLRSKASRVSRSWRNLASAPPFIILEARATSESMDSISSPNSSLLRAALSSSHRLSSLHRSASEASSMLPAPGRGPV